MIPVVIISKNTYCFSAFYRFTITIQYEDAEQDLTVALIEIINQMPANLFDGEISTSVFAALSYIKKAIKKLRDDLDQNSQAKK